MVESKLREDHRHAIKAVMCVHNETSTGVTSRIQEVRQAMDRTGHPALLMVDTISSLGSIDYRHDEWSVDHGFDEAELRKLILNEFDLSLGSGLGKLKGQGLSDWPPWGFKRFDVVWDIVRGRNGPRSIWCSIQERRSQCRVGEVNCLSEVASASSLCPNRATDSRGDC
jgi:hypothetical protein